jgi:7-carboxy-7-deazaguanine synthase
MAYSVKEIYYTLQGEGAQSGRAAVFCRFSGCNLWTGREGDRATAICSFCDTDFVGTDGPGGGRFSNAEGLAEAVASQWPGDLSEGRSVAGGRPLVVCTGGEPLLQLDSAAVAQLQRRGFEVAVETNGTIEPPAGIDWLCVSPKGGSECVVRRGDELKLVYPQPGLSPEDFADWDFRHFFLQPMDGVHQRENLRAAIDYCLAHPQWRLSIQAHKAIGIP